MITTHLTPLRRTLNSSWTYTTFVPFSYGYCCFIWTKFIWIDASCYGASDELIGNFLWSVIFS